MSGEAGVFFSLGDFEWSNEWSDSDVGFGNDPEYSFFASATFHTDSRLDTVDSVGSSTGISGVKHQVGSLKPKNSFGNLVPSPKVNIQGKNQ